MNSKTTIDSAKRVLALEIEELRRTSEKLGQDFVEAVATLGAARTSEKKIVVFGVGKCSHIGEKIAATMTSTGTPAVALNSLNALHGDLGIVQNGDVILALSYSGETEEIVNLISALRRFEVSIIAMTGSRESMLAKHSDITLDVGVEREACPLKIAPTSSTTVMLALGDALAMVLLEESGFREEDFVKFHPGGSLGRKLLTTAKDLMRTEEKIVIVPQQTTVDTAIDAMTECRVGAAIVTNPENGVAGVFTHGDFVRSFRKHGGEVSEMTVDQLMTPEPISVLDSSIAVEVLGILKTHRIDELIVVDADSKPVGLIDVQDLSRLGLH